MTNAEATEIRLKGLVLGAGAMGGGPLEEWEEGSRECEGPI